MASTTSDAEVHLSVAPASRFKKPVFTKPFVIEVAVSGFLAFLGIGALSLLHFGLSDSHDYTIILGSFGASAVLLFGAPTVPFSQPRNCIGGRECCTTQTHAPSRTEAISRVEKRLSLLIDTRLCLVICRFGLVLCWSGLL
jgi:hypothetical protein